MLIQMGSCNTLIQVMVPDRLRGRVMSVYSMMLIGIGPIGALIGGALAARIGAPWTVAICGMASLVGAAAFASQLPGLRGPARALINQQGLTLEQPPVTIPRA